jgi:hypothetical protein
MANQAREKRGLDIDFSELFELPEVDMNFPELDFELPEIEYKLPPELDFDFSGFDFELPVVDEKYFLQEIQYDNF